MAGQGTTIPRNKDIDILPTRFLIIGKTANNERTKRNRLYHFQRNYRDGHIYRRRQG
jgi:hypothetical protein